LILRVCVTSFCLRLKFLKLFAVSFGLLRGQLKDRRTQQQQNRGHQPIRFHIGKKSHFREGNMMITPRQNCSCEKSCPARGG